MPFTNQDLRNSAFIDPWAIIFPTGSITASGRWELLGQYYFTGRRRYNPNNDRYIPMEYLPRWMAPYYDTSSFFRKWYFLTLFDPKQEAFYFMDNEICSWFYTTVGQDRIGHVAKYDYDHRKGYVPSITLSLAGSSFNLKKLDSLGSMIANKTERVWLEDRFNLYFKNLALTTASATAMYGILELNPILLTEPKVKDSIIVLTNAYGDNFYITPDSMLIDSDNVVSIGVDGAFTVTYLSQRLLDQINDGTAYITIDGNKVPLKPYLFANGWDYRGALKGIKRRDSEDNFSLKRKCQHLGFSRKLEQRIAILLGKSQAATWESRTDLSLVGSGATTVEVFSIYERPQIAEFPFRVGNDLVLTRTPTGHLELFYKDRWIDPSNYTVSGAVISFNQPSLINAEQNDIRVSYTTSQYTVTSSGGSVSSISRTVGGQDTLLAIWSDGVVASPTTKKIKEWKWDRENGKLVGLANFVV